MIIVLLIVLGLCAGSFVNALVWRLHQLQHKNLSAKQQNTLSVVRGRSMCTDCKHLLSATDLVPVFSWLYLRGKCRYCRKCISVQYPIVELLTAGLFAVSYIYWPVAVSGRGLFDIVVWLFALVGLVALTAYDLKWMLLPNTIVYKLMSLAIFGVLVDAFVFNQTDALFAAIYGGLVGGGIFYVLFQVSKGKWIGGGDVKLGALLGILVGGPMNALAMLFVASLLGCIVSAVLLIFKKANPTSRIPFGPFLIVAAIIIKLFGVGLIVWYQNRMYIT